MALVTQASIHASMPAPRLKLHNKTRRQVKVFFQQKCRSQAYVTRADSVQKSLQGAHNEPFGANAVASNRTIEYRQDSEPVTQAARRAFRHTLKAMHRAGFLSWSRSGRDSIDVKCGSQYNERRRGWMLLLTSVAAALLFFSGPAHLAIRPTWALTEENLIFLEAWRIVDRAYVDKSFNGQSWFRYREDALRREPMKTRDQTYAAIRKMLATLDDPFTRFLEPEKFKSLKSGTSGAVTGVGLEVGFDMTGDVTSEQLVVVAPVTGGPAERAGVLPGDLIVAIDGVPTNGMGLYEAAQRLQGPVNSEVGLTLQSHENLKTVTVLREKITLNPVSWRLCEVQRDGDPPLKLGYIRLSTFNQNSSRAVKDAIKFLKNDGAKAFVLDIRNNSGGLFPAGIEIAKMWLDKGVIVYIADSMGVRDIYETDGEDAIATTEPLAVLVNKGTASASEILAGALKDNQRAVIIGEPTFGKGRIQSVFELSDGSGMAVTIARYETPAHINIDKVGITPDHSLPSFIPMDGESFCRCVEDPTSGCNIPVSALFSR